jgi:4-amino-4-deoxy-L-arabinose transferase-like glycosyltransferase
MTGSGRPLALLLVLCAAFFLTSTGDYTHFLRAESNFALGARDMIEKGEYLLPHAAHEAPLNKPPLQYWLIGIAYAVLGYSHGASRVPAALCAMAVVALVYLMGCRMRDRFTGLTAAGVLATSYIFWSFARLAMNDMLFTLCMTATLACWMPVLAGEARRPAMLAHAGTAAVALGFLTKGPLAIALCALPVIVVAVAARDARLIGRLRPVAGTLVFLGVATPYFLLIGARYGVEPLRNWFINENLQRFTGASYETSQVPVLFEIGALLGDFAPWSLLLVATACAYGRLAAGSPERRRHLLLLLAWIAAPVVFFSASSFKLDYYFMTSLPAAALLVALTPLDAQTGRAWADRVATGAMWTLVLLPPAVMAATVPVVAANLPASAIRWLPHVVALATFVPVPVLLWRGSRSRVPLALCVHLWAAAMTSYLVHVPAYSRLLPADVLAAQVPAGSRVYTSRAADTWALDLSLYLPTVEPVGVLHDDLDNRRLAAVLRSDPRAVALVYQRDRQRLEALGLPLRELARAEANTRPQLTPDSLARPAFDTLYLVTAAP